MRILIDIVPNHEAATAENTRWQEALQTHEPGWFDVDWPHGRPRYRRFFDVDGLVAVRVEDEPVFRASHALVFELLELGIVDGLRVDHVDGLADPGTYLDRLDRTTGGVFTVVEKILARDERLPDWPVAGTTGYEMGDALTALCVDPDGRARLERALFAENGGASFAVVEHESKALVLDEIFRPEWSRVCDLLDDDALAPALRRLTLDLDVYRTYADTPDDCLRLERASASIQPTSARALHDLLLVEPATELADALAPAHRSRDGEGPRGHRVLPVPGAARPERGRGRPGRGRARDAVPRFHALARGLLGIDRDEYARHETQRRRASTTLCVVRT